MPLLLIAYKILCITAMLEKRRPHLDVIWKERIDSGERKAAQAVARSPFPWRDIGYCIDRQTEGCNDENVLAMVVSSGRTCDRGSTLNAR